MSLWLPNSVVDSTSALQAEGRGFDPRQRHEPHKLIYLVHKFVSYREIGLFLSFCLNCLELVAETCEGGFNVYIKSMSHNLSPYV